MPHNQAIETCAARTGTVNPLHGLPAPHGRRYVP
jgi:hypothetical protein